MQIAYILLAVLQEHAALTAIIPMLYDMHPTTLLLSTSPHGSVPSLALFLHVSNSQPATDQW